MAKKFELTAELNLQSPKNIDKVLREIQRKIKSPSVELKFKGAKQAAKDVNEVAKANRGLKKETEAASKAASALGKQLGSALKNVLRYDIARRVFYTFAGAIEQGAKDAISFQREIIKIKQVSGGTEKQLKSLERTITGVSTELGISSSALVKTGLILKQTGLSVQDTTTALKALAKTELAPTFGSIADTAETAVAAMRQFKIQAKDLEGILDKINVVAANFAIESEDIGVAVKRAGGAFAAAGGQIEELIALMTSVRSTTRETAETIATGFRTIFTRLQRPTTIKFLREFGIELTDLQGKFIGPYKAIEQLNNALANLDPSDLRFSAIVEQLGGFRQVSKVIPLIKQFDVAQRAMNAQLNASGSLAKDAKTAQEALAVQLATLREEVKALFRSLTDSGAFEVLTKGAISFAKAITKVVDAFSALMPMLALFAATRIPSLTRGALGGLGGGGRDGGAGNFMGFNRGGKVPGVGNADSVPAMLTPGEFVVNKKAAQRMGFAKLHGINRLHNGGYTKGISGSNFTPEDLIEYYRANPEAASATEADLIGFRDAKNKGRAKAMSQGDTYFAGAYDKFEEERMAGLVQEARMQSSPRPKGSPSSQDDPLRSSSKSGKKNRTIFVGADKVVDNVDDLLGTVNDKLEEAKEIARRENLSSGKISKSRRSPETIEAIRRQKEASRADRVGASIGRTFHSGGKPLTPQERTMFEDREAELAAQARERKREDDLLRSPGRIPPDPKGPSLKDRGQSAFDSASDAIGQGLKSFGIFAGATAASAALAEQFGIVSKETAEFATGMGVTIGILKGLQDASSGFADSIEALTGGKSKFSKGLRNRSEFGLLSGITFDGDNVRRRASRFKSLSSAREGILARRESALDRLKEADWTKGRDSEEFKSAKAAVDLEDKNFAAQERRFKQAKEHNAIDQRRVKTSKALTAAAGIAAAALSQLGSTIKQKAMADIEAGNFEGAAKRAGLGGGLQFGAQGAIAGAQIGGPWGAVIGAATGALYGFITATEEAKQRIAEVKISKSLEATKQSLEDFQNGAISAKEGLTKLSTEILVNQESLKRIDSAERIKGGRVRREAALGFLEGLGKQSGSLEEFERAVDNNAKHLREHGIVTAIDIKRTREKINSRLEFEEKSRAIEEAKRQAQEQRLIFKGISNVISELNTDVSKFGEVVNAVASSGRGVGSIGSISSVFQTNPRSRGGISRFNESIINIGESASDAGLNQFSGDVISATAIQRNLQESISKTLKSGSINPDNIGEELQKNIKDSLKSEGTPLTKAVEGRLKDAIRSIDITNLQDQQKEVTDAVNDVLGDTIKPFQDFAQLLDERNKFLKNSLGQLYSLETSYLSSLRKAQDAQIKAQDNFAKNISTSNFGFESDKDVQARFFRRLDQISSAAGGTNADTRNVNSIISRLKDLQKLIIENEKEKVSLDSGSTAEQQEKLIRTGAKLNREFNTLQKILNEYGNSQQRLTALNERLQRAQQREDFLKGGVRDIVFGDANTSAQTTRLFSAIQKAFNEGTLANIPSDIRQEVARLLEDPKSPFGQKGADIVASDLSKIATSLGLAADAFTKTSKEREETSRQIKIIEDVAATAFSGLASAEKSRIDSLANTISTQNGTFLKSLKSLFQEEQGRQTSLDVEAQRKNVESLQKVQDFINSLDVGEDERATIFRGLQDAGLMKSLDKMERMQANASRLPRVPETALQDYWAIDSSAKNIAGVVGKFNEVTVEKLQQTVSNLDRYRRRGGELDWIQQNNLDSSRALIQILKMSGMDKIRQRAGEGNELLDRGFSGAAQDNLLQSMSTLLGGEDIESFIKFERTLQEIVDSGVDAGVAFTQIAKALNDARNEQLSNLEVLNKNPIFSSLQQVPKELRNVILDSGITGSLGSFNTEVANAKTELENLRTKLETITGSRKTKLEQQEALKTGVNKVKEVAAPIVDKVKEIFGVPRLSSSVQEAQGIRSGKLEDLAKRIERAEKPDSGVDPEKIKGMYEAMNAIKKEGVDSDKSLSVHDHHAVPVLEEILLTLKGQGQTGTAGGEQTTLSFNRVDTTALDQSINTFSKSVTDLSEVMNTPITMEVGGEITVNVNMTGAELLQENEAAFAQIAGRKVTDGINNFIRSGLRTSSIAIKGDWA